mmetsp:Transcript_72727/g.117964  ORF Transcript_72727/g.117964 Transcript_72727/m.117964 type:complete len:461 (-) Transcript_72727:658-2040(-)
MATSLLSFMDARGKVGIGLKQNEKGEMLIVWVASGGPAAVAGIQSGDVLEQIDGKATPKTFDATGSALNGPVDSAVTVTVRRSRVFGSSSFTLKLKRRGTPPPAPSAHSGTSTASAVASAQSTTPNSGAFSITAIFNQVHASLGGAEGIGVKLQHKDGLVVIRGIQKGGGADKTAGRVQAGDVVVEIDGKTAGSSLDDVSARLAGVRGSEVKLRLRRTGVFGFQMIDVTCVREAPEPPETVTSRPLALRSDAGSQEHVSGSDDAHGLFAGWAAGMGTSIGSGIRDSIGSSLGASVAVGIGVEFALKAEKVLVVGMLPNGAAAKEGSLRVADSILKIDGNPVGQSLDAIRAQVLGDIHTTVVLTVERKASFMGPEIRIIKIRRDAMGAKNSNASSQHFGSPPAHENSSRTQDMRSDDKKVHSVHAEAKDGTNSSMLEDAAFIFSLQTFSCTACSAEKQHIP